MACRPGPRAAFALALVVLVAAGSALGVRDRDADADARAGELLVIVHADNHATPSASELEAMFRRKQLAWSDGERVIPLNAAAESERRVTFDRVVLGMSPEEAARFWLDQRIRGAGGAPREVGDPYLTVKLVSKLRGAIGYVPADSELPAVRIVARIRDGKLVSP